VFAGLGGNPGGLPLSVFDGFRIGGSNSEGVIGRQLFPVQ
jgi:hypothetical protein